MSTGDKKNCWFTAQRRGGGAAEWFFFYCDICTLQKQAKVMVKLLPARQNRRSRIGKTGVALKVAFLLAVGQDLALLELVIL